MMEKKTAKKPKTRRLKSAQRQAEIVQAALRLAHEKNIDTITTDSIAQILGLTQGAIFRHFPKKEAIWTAAVEWVDKVMMEAIQRAVKKPQAPMDELQSIFLCLADLLVRHPGMAQVMFHELQRPDDLESKEIMQTTVRHLAIRFETVIEKGKASGEIANDIDTAIGARMMLGALDGLVTQSAIDRKPKAIGAEARMLFPLLQKALSN